MYPKCKLNMASQRKGVTMKFKKPLINVINAFSNKTLLCPTVQANS